MNVSVGKAAVYLAMVPRRYRDTVLELFSEARKNPDLADLSDEAILAAICSMDAQEALGFRPSPANDALH